MKIPAALAILAALLLPPFANATPAAAKSPAWQAAPGQPGHYVNSVALSRDGGRVVGGTFFHSYSGGGGEDGTFGTYCYDRAGHLVWKNEFTGWQGVYWTDMSADGAYAASGGWFSHHPYAGFVRAFDAANGNLLLDHKTKERVNQVALTADGSRLVSAAESLVLFRRRHGAYRLADEYAAPASATGSNYFVAAALSADGDTLACADFAGHLLLFSTAGDKLKLQRQWSLPGGYSHSVRITPDGRTFACGGGSGDFYVFDTADFRRSGKPTAGYLSGQAGSVYGVAISDDGQAAAGLVNYQSSQGMVYFVARHGRQCTLRWKYQTAHNPNCASLVLSHGLLAVADGHPDGSPGSYYLLRTADGSLRWSYTTTNMNWPVMIAADGSAVAAGSDDSSLYYFTP